MADQVPGESNPSGSRSSSADERVDRIEEEGGLRARLLRFSRVPHRPEPPPGDPALLRVFRAGKNYLRYKYLGWSLAQLAAFVPLFISTVGLGILAIPEGSVIAEIVGIFTVGDEVFDAVADNPDTPILALLAGPIFLLTWGLFATQAVLSFLALRIDYELRWYMLSDRALRIRQGVFSVREQTMTYANIQQISVRRGPLQKLLGLGDVEVRTAGGGGAKGGGGHAGAQAAKRDLHRGFFKGVENPEEIRDVIRERVERYREAGLGDPDELTATRRDWGGVDEEAGAEPVGAVPGADTRSPSSLAAARALLSEIRALRSEISR